MSAAVAVLVKGYPRLSETFIAREILALERRGLDIRLYSLRRPADRRRHRVHDHIRAPVVYLPEYLYREPLRVWRGWRVSARLKGYSEAWRAWLRDLIRDPTPNRVRRFGQALVLARELPRGVRHIHVHFLHTPGSVARYAAILRGLPWSFSAHAKDVWTTPDWEKAEKLASCAWGVTCTRANLQHLAALAPADGRLELVYHGIDVRQFPPPASPPARDGRDPRDPAVILSIGRAVKKKGYGGLLAALARLPQSLAWRFVHIGGGPLLGRLRRQARRAGIADRVAWMGPETEDRVLAAYRGADVFVLNSRIADDGDRDGLPNVLVEAQSQGLACVSTAVSAIPELIEDGRTGLLVRPDDPAALSAALAHLIADPELRRRLGAAGLARVRAEFSFERGIDRLAARFGLTDGAARR